MEPRGVAFAVTPPEQLWPEIWRWSERACLRRVAKQPALFGLRQAYGSAAEVAACVKKALARRGADLRGFPANASSWIRVLSEAEFEALAAESDAAADLPAAPDSDAELSAHSDGAADVDASQHTPTPPAADDSVAPRPGSVCCEPLPPPEPLLAFPAPMSVAGPASASASARRLGVPSLVGPDFARSSQQRLQELLATRAAHETLAAC